MHHLVPIHTKKGKTCKSDKLNNASTVNDVIQYKKEVYLNHNKPYTVEELEYLCKYYEADGAEYMSAALDRPISSIRTTVYRLKKSGQFDFYRNLNRYY